jgi:hypothetical protein
MLGVQAALALLELLPALRRSAPPAPRSAWHRLVVRARGRTRRLQAGLLALGAIVVMRPAAGPGHGLARRPGGGRAGAGHHPRDTELGHSRSRADRVLAGG